MARTVRPVRRLVPLLALTLALAACGGPAEPPAPEAAEPAPQDPTTDEPDWVQEGGPLVIGRATVVTADSVAPLAEQEGWFGQAGLDVTVVEERSPIDLLPLLVSGDIDVMFMAVTPAAFAAFAEGVQMRIPATTLIADADTCSTTGLLGDAERLSAIDPADPTTTRGLRIGGTFRSLTSARYLDALTRSWGITVDDLELVEVPLDAHLAALRDGQVDAVFTVDPVLTLGTEETDAIAAYPTGEVNDGDVLAFLLFGPRLLEDRELGARYLAVHLHALERLNLGATEGNVALLSRLTGLEPELLARTCIPPQTLDGRPHEARLTEMWEFAVARGDVERVVPAAEVWDHGFLDRARELLETGAVTLTD